MGNHLDRPAPPLAEFQREVASQLAFRANLRGGPFLRTLHCLHAEHGAVVVKVRVPTPGPFRAAAAHTAARRCTASGRRTARRAARRGLRC